MSPTKSLGLGRRSLFSLSALAQAIFSEWRKAYAGRSSQGLLFPGRELGGRHHTTTLYSMRKIEEMGRSLCPGCSDQAINERRRLASGQ